MELLEKHFEIALETPDGIKKLRELILLLAMQGKLVPQYQNDEPASELVKRVEAETKRLLKTGKLKNHVPLLQVKNEEIPYEIPPSWEWVRIGTIAQHNSGKTLDNGRNKGTQRDYITTSNLYWGNFLLNKLRKMPIMDSELKKCSARKGDLLICEGGEAGRAAVWESSREICFQNHIHRVRFFCNINPYYAYRFFEKLNYTGEINNYRKGVAISNMSSKALASIIFPLPPLEEQKRIVAKIDQLMVLCDKLEAERNERNSKRLTIHTAAINKLLTASNNPEFNKSWNFISENFSELYSVPENVEELKKAILQLAVMGKLVPQDPNDQPASELMKKVKAEKELLFKEGKIKKFESLKPISVEERPSNIPLGWIWVRFGEITINRDGERVPISKENRVHLQGTYDYYGASGVIDKINDYIFDKDLLLIGEDGANLINRSTPIAFIAHGKYWVNNHAHVIDSTDSDLLKYLEKYINAIDLKPYVTGTAQPKMNQAKMNSIPIALPPLAEQKRIVDKIDELMSLCNRLAQQFENSTNKQYAILKAILSKL